MNPKSDMDLLHAYLSGELPADQAAVLQSRLNDEPGLCELLAALARDEAILCEWARATTQTEKVLFDPYHQWLGIQPKDQPPNHYRLLGIETFEEDHVVIGNAADQRMVHLRMFQNGRHSRDSQRLLNEVAKAKVCLLNHEQKVEYDRKLQSEMQASDTCLASSFSKTTSEKEPLVQQPVANPQKLNRGILAGLAIAASLLLVITGIYVAVTSKNNPSEGSQTASTPDGAPREAALEGNRPEVPVSSSENAPSLPPVDAPRETPRTPPIAAVASVPAVVEPGTGHASTMQEELVADQLLELTLTLSQTDDATEQMWIYQKMASTLLMNVAQTDPADGMAARFLGNYIHLVQEGVLPRLVVTQLPDQHGKVRDVASFLQADCQILETLHAKEGAWPQSSLTEAQLVSNQCRTRAESLLTN